MQSLEDLKDEAEITKKTRQKKRVRGVLLIVDALLLAYAGYLTVASIVDAVNANKSKSNETITLFNKSATASLKIYDSYIDEKFDVNDFALYGNYLLTSKSRVSATDINCGNKIKLCKIADTTKKGVQPGTRNTIDGIGTTLDTQINLFNLEKGEYFLYEGESSISKEQVYHYTGETYLEETIYSFPNESGERKKITVKGVATSPALVITVTMQKDALPANYYDIVIVDTKNLSVNWFNDSGLKIKTVDSIKEAYTYNSCYALNITEGNVLKGSAYVQGTTEHSDKFPSEASYGAYAGLDDDDAIRELGGYVFHSGEGLKENETSIEIMKVKSSSHKGKYTLSIGKDFENPYYTIKEKFGF